MKRSSLTFGKISLSFLDAISNISKNQSTLKERNAFRLGLNNLILSRTIKKKR